MPQFDSFHVEQETFYIKCYIQVTSGVYPTLSAFRHSFFKTWSKSLQSVTDRIPESYPYPEIEPSLLAVQLLYFFIIIQNCCPSFNLFLLFGLLPLKADTLLSSHGK